MQYRTHPIKTIMIEILSEIKHTHTVFNSSNDGPESGT